MEKFFRFAARRPRLCKLLYLLFPTLPLSVSLALLDVSWLENLLYTALVLLPSYLLVDLSGILLMSPKVKNLNENCDPIPLFEVSGFLLTCRQRSSHRIVTAMNHAVALRDLGAFEEALKVMEGVNLSRPRKIPAMVKFVYFHNLTDLLDNLGRREEADAMYARAMEFWGTVPPRRKTPALENTLRFSQAFAHCRRGEFSRAVASVQDMNCTSPRQQVERGMLLARCAIALGQTQRAAEWLSYVISHSNRLYLVALAQNLLDNLENT